MNYAYILWTNCDVGQDIIYLMDRFWVVGVFDCKQRSVQQETKSAKRRASDLLLMLD